MSKVFKYVLDFSANTQKFGKDIGGVKSLVKGAAVAAGALFAADKIMDAADAVADYAKEISNVNIQVQKLTGAQGAALDQMTGQVQALAGAYGDDVEATLEAQNSLMQNFGDSSKAAFDVLNAGYATAANSGGDFTKQISEYSAHFKEAGLNASQMVAVIAQGNKMGVFDDKAADSIKEASLRLREMTSSTKQALQMIGLSSTQIQQDIASGNKSMFEVMQMVSRQLQTLPAQSPAVGAALADIFGGPGEDGIKFVRMLAGVNTNLDDVVKQSGDASSAQMEWTKTLADFHTMGSQVFGGTSTLITKVKTAALKFVVQFAKGIVDLANYFIDLYNESMVFRGAINAIGLGFKLAWAQAKFFFTELFDVLKGAGKLIKAVFTGNFSEIPKIISDAWKEVKDDAVNFGKGVADAFIESAKNTITPREKIKLITLSADEAVKAGAEMAKNFSKGFHSKTNVPTMAVAASASVKLNSKDADKFKLNMKPKMDVSNILKNMPVFQEALKEANIFLDATKAKMEAVQGAFAQGFAAIGQSVVQGLGLAEHGLEGFLGKLFETATQLIAMMLSQSIANAIFSATSSAAATGPAAIFTQPAFMATMIGGVMAAFAAIPKFATGGVVAGNSFAGDKMLVRVNSGEEILRRDDPRHRFNSGMASGTSVMNVMFAQDGIQLRGQTLRIGIKKSERMSKYLGR